MPTRIIVSNLRNTARLGSHHATITSNNVRSRPNPPTILPYQLKFQFPVSNTSTTPAQTAKRTVLPAILTDSAHYQWRRRQCTRQNGDQYRHQATASRSLHNLNDLIGVPPEIYAAYHASPSTPHSPTCHLRSPVEIKHDQTFPTNQKTISQTDPVSSKEPAHSPIIGLKQLKFEKAKRRLSNWHMYGKYADTDRRHMDIADNVHAGDKTEYNTSGLSQMTKIELEAPRLVRPSTRYGAGAETGSPEKSFNHSSINNMIAILMEETASFESSTVPSPRLTATSDSIDNKQALRKEILAGAVNQAVGAFFGGRRRLIESAPEILRSRFPQRRNIAIGASAELDAIWRSMKVC